MAKAAHFLLILAALTTGGAHSQTAPAAEPSFMQLGLEKAAREWREDPAETALIQTAKGQIARLRNVLLFRAALADGTRFVDFVPEEDMADSYVERYKLSAVVGRYAVVTGTFYEDSQSYLVDMKTGATQLIGDVEPIVSPGQRYITFQHPGSPETGPAIIILDTATPLRIAMPEPRTHIVEGGSFVWEGNETLRANIVTYTKLQDNALSPEAAGQARITMTKTGIEMRIDKTGEVIKTPFKPLTLK